VVDARTAELLVVVRSGGSAAGERDAAWRQLFEHDPVIAASAAFDLLAGEPRIKPSHSLVVDPGDSVRRRWELRVAAAAALLAAPVAAQVFDEVRDELAEDADLAADVLASSVPTAALTDLQRAALHVLGRPARGGSAAGSPS
jgi:hypothetical protein